MKFLLVFLQAKKKHEILFDRKSGLNLFVTLKLRI